MICNIEGKLQTLCTHVPDWYWAVLLLLLDRLMLFSYGDWILESFIWTLETFSRHAEERSFKWQILAHESCQAQRWLFGSRSCFCLDVGSFLMLFMTSHGIPLAQELVWPMDATQSLLHQARLLGDMPGWLLRDNSSSVLGPLRPISSPKKRCERIEKGMWVSQKLLDF